MEIGIAQVIFIIISAVALAGALGVVLSRNVFRAALLLVLSFVGVAGLYVMLEAELLAMIQILVYVGAISILIVFAIMLSSRIMSPDFQARNEQWFMGLVAAVVLFGVLAFVLLSVQWPIVPSEVPEDAISLLGQALVGADQFVLPFEVASVLLLVALVGSVVIAREK
jgi:NADH:ubiquinone oxidoreductase subunit 6 (subunit J)